jgi:hypothetical protein
MPSMELVWSSYSILQWTCPRERGPNGQKDKRAQLITGSYSRHKMNVNERVIVQPNVYPPQASPLREG